MAKEIINVATPNSTTGDPLRSAFVKTNDNFTELYDKDVAIDLAIDAKISGAGTANKLVKFTAAGVIGNSGMSEFDGVFTCDTVMGSILGFAINGVTTGFIGSDIRIGGSANDFAIFSASGGTIFYSNATAVGKILPNGNFAIGKLSADEMLDVLGNGKFSGTLSCGQYTTATEPAYVKGAQFFNTTLNKTRIGGATVYETMVTALGDTDIEITDFTKGYILPSPDGTRWRITVANDGALTTTAI